MNKRQKVRLVLCFVAIAACVVFIISLSNRFGTMRTHGFDLTEYWSLAVFGIVFAVIVSIYALVDAIRIAVGAKSSASKNDGKNDGNKKPTENSEEKKPDGGDKKPDEQPVPLPKEEKKPTEQRNTSIPLPNSSHDEQTAEPWPFPQEEQTTEPWPFPQEEQTTEPWPFPQEEQTAEPWPFPQEEQTTEPLPFPQEEQVTPSEPILPTPQEPVPLPKEEEKPTEEKSEPKPAPEKKKKLSFSEKRKQKLLQDEPQKKGGAFGWIVLIVGIVFGVYFSVWSYFPNELCYHNYTYNNTVNGQIGDEPRAFRFYQDYGFSPYYVYVHQTKEFKVKLKSKRSGSDEIGKYVEYEFYLNEKYAKILDCALDRFTYIEVVATVRHYSGDGRIVVSQTVTKNRLSESVTEIIDNKVYTYTTLQQ